MISDPYRHKWLQFKPALTQLTHCGLMTPYWGHRSGSTLAQADDTKPLEEPTLTPSSRSSDFCLGAIPQEISQPSINQISWKIIHLRLWIHSLWPSDVIRRQGTGSTLAQVMACCLTAPIHYLNQCWLSISKVLCHSSEGIMIMRRSEDTNQ